MTHMRDIEVNGLLVPSLFVQLLREGRWQHPGDEVMGRVIPFLRQPVVFLNEIVSIRQESSGSLAGESGRDAFFHIARGSKSDEAICLPWLDADLVVFIAVNRIWGDDVGIALDYRTGAADPRVVASEWEEAPAGCKWREVTPTFSEFVKMLGI
jgi:hypothetical protein